MTRSRSVRGYVIQLVAAVTLPFLAFGAFLLIRAAQHEQQAIATTAHERAQGAAADLDRELHNLHDFISVLATSYYRFGGDFAWSHPHWISLLKGRDLGFLVRDSLG